MENQTYEEAVEKVVAWWTEKTFHTPNNQDNGGGPMFFGVMNRLADSFRKQVTPEKIVIFQNKLKELLLSNGHAGVHFIYLGVDYDPCEELYLACQAAEINTKLLPCKSDTRIEKDFKVHGKFTYDGTWEEI